MSGISLSRQAKKRILTVLVGLGIALIIAGMSVTGNI
jgi:hypothetical protein